MDKIDKAKRSEMMSKVKGKNTKPEMVVRSLLHGMGYRFRLHRKDLPGRPDIVLPKHKTVVFVHGCFWHGHIGCPRAARPTSNTEFWDKKLSGNMERDKRNVSLLADLGWRVVTVWECRIKDTDGLAAELKREITQKNTMETDI